jgi:hypothetical protein
VFSLAVRFHARTHPPRLFQNNGNGGVQSPSYAAFYWLDPKQVTFAIPDPILSSLDPDLTDKRLGPISLAWLFFGVQTAVGTDSIDLPD